MRNRLFLVIAFVLLILPVKNVDAKIVSKDDIEDNSYIIGTYYFTRTPNTEYSYDGVLDTKKMLLAAKSINGGLDAMKVYYKDFLGNWINGITGESITPPNTFKIDNRNLRDILDNPYLDCNFSKKLSCSASVMVDDTLNYGVNSYRSSDSNISSFNGGVEFYTLKKSDGTVPDKLAYFDPVTGKFKLDSEVLTIVNMDYLNSENYYEDTEPFMQVVSRFYYLDGEEKIYSEYSNIQTNGASVKFQLLPSTVKIDATINEDYGVKVDSSYGDFGPGLNSEVNYYNVKFNLSGVDTSKYMIKEYRVYSAVDAKDGYEHADSSAISSALGGSSTLEYLYMEGLYDKKYTVSRRFAGGTNDAYLIANASGMDGVGMYHDVSSTSAYSKRLYWPGDEEDDVSRNVVARATICDLDQSECYEISPYLSASTGNPTYVR